jgi:hypothetical protein
MRKMMNEPAIAKEETSTPNTPRRGVPMNKNARKMNREVMVTFAGLIFTPFDFMSMIIGIDPGMSIIAKSTINAASISSRLNFIGICFYKDIKKDSLSFVIEGEGTDI